MHGNMLAIATAKGNYEEALEFINKSNVRNYHSHSVRHAKAFILRKLKKKKEAVALIEESLELDPFNFGCLFEKHLLLSDPKEMEIILNQLKQLSRNWSHNFIEYALDYAHAGLFDEAIELLLVYYDNCENPYSLVPYYLGWFAWESGDTETAALYFEEGARLQPHFVFPSRLEEILILQKAIEVNSSDNKAWYPAKALKALELAFTNDTSDARVLMELDQLYKRLNKDHNERLQFLEQHLQLVSQRDDLFLERITLYNQLGNYTEAKSLIAAYNFHPWEGGEGKVVGQYLICHLELAKHAMAKENYQLALSLLEQAEIYPTNLGEGKLTGAQENDTHYWKGVAWEMMNDSQKANDYYIKATKGISEPVQAIFYNDPQPDKIFYQGLAWIKLKNQNKAFELFQSLVDFGKKHIDDTVSIDYFAVSLPDLLVFDADLNLRNRIHCLYLMALGHLGLGDVQKAGELFDQILALDRNHQGTLVHKNMMNYLTLIEH